MVDPSHIRTLSDIPFVSYSTFPISSYDYSALALQCSTRAFRLALYSSSSNIPLSSDSITTIGEPYAWSSASRQPAVELPPLLPTYYTVTWLDGAGNTLKSEKLQEGQEYTDLYPPDPTRTGYTFAGWSSPVTDSDGNVTITAEWSKDPATADDINDSINEQTEEMKKGFAGILDAITKLPQTILDGIVHLFVPTEEELSDIMQEFDDLLKDKFGAGYQAAEIIDSLFSSILDNLNSSTPYDFVFPGIKFPMNGETIVILDETPVSLDNKVMDVLRPVAGTAVIIISILAFINTMKNFIEHVVSGKGIADFDGSD